MNDFHLMESFKRPKSLFLPKVVVYRMGGERDRHCQRTIQLIHELLGTYSRMSGWFGWVLLDY